MGIVYGPKWPFYSCCDYIGLFGTSFIQVLYLGRASRTKETLLTVDLSIMDMSEFDVILGMD